MKTNILLGLCLLVLIPIFIISIPILFIGFIYYFFIIPAMMFIQIALGGMLLSEFIKNYIFPW